jgi:hypothetical protein
MNTTPSDSEKGSVSRVVVLFFAVLFTALSLVGMYSIISERRVHSVVQMLFYVLAAGVAWFLSVRNDDAPINVLSRSGIVWAFRLGAPALAIGFFAPILLGFGGNAGPLLGIAFTGPLGAIIGGLVGVVRALPEYRAAKSAARRT